MCAQSVPKSSAKCVFELNWAFVIRCRQNCPINMECLDGICEMDIRVVIGGDCGCERCTREGVVSLPVICPVEY